LAVRLEVVGLEGDDRAVASPGEHAVWASTEDQRVADDGVVDRHDGRQDA
jgi:hypothetical protein